MSCRISVPAVPLMLLVFLGALLPSANPPAASAAPSDPTGGPVTVTDRVRVPADNTTLIRPLRNDSDPSGQSLDVCRTQPTLRHRPETFPVAGTSYGFIRYGRRPVDAPTSPPPPPPQNANHLAIITFGVSPGTYAVTYHACDRRYAVAGTVLVTVTRSINLQVHKVAGRDGTLRLHNPDARPLRVELDIPDASGDYDGPAAEHRVLHLRPHEVRLVHVDSTEVSYDATLPDHQDAGDGLVDGIDQPHRHAPHVAGRRGRPHAVRAADEPTADQADDQAPVTQADTVSIPAASSDGTEADVLANDSDADDPHRTLQICRVSVPADSGLTATPLYQGGFGGSTSILLVGTTQAVPGTYQLTYDPCDEHLLTPGTLTVTVTAAQDLQVTEVGAHTWRFTNPGDRTYHVQISRGERVAQRFVLEAGQSRAVHLRGRQLGWYARWGSDSTGGSLTYGH